AGHRLPGGELLGELQPRALRLELGGHAVELAHQEPQFVLAALFGKTDRQIARRDLQHALGEPLHRPGEGAAQEHGRRSGKRSRSPAASITARSLRRNRRPLRRFSIAREGTRKNGPSRASGKKNGQSRPVSRVLSRRVVASSAEADIPLGPALPPASSGLPGSTAGHRIAPLCALSPGGACRAAPVTRSAVRSYRTVSPLPEFPPA